MSSLMSLHSALAQALLKDLPDIEYQTRDWVSWNNMDSAQQAVAHKTRTEPSISKSRRPQEHEVEVYLFPQTWGSTALGYGGMGGSAITDAYTVVVCSHNTACVYFGEGELAYRVRLDELSDQGHQTWRDDLGQHRLADRGQHLTRYSRK